jgi:hypothetical protein
MRKQRVLTPCSNRVPGVADRGNRPRTLKLGAISHKTAKICEKTVCKSPRKYRNTRKRRVLTTRSNRVPGVTDRRNRPGTLKLCASPQKRPKYAKGEFRRRTQIVYRGSRTVEFGPEPDNCVLPHENAQNMQKQRVSTTCLNRFRGSCTVEFGPEPDNCVLPHENAQNMQKQRVSTTCSNRVPGVTNRANRPGTPN